MHWSIFSQRSCFTSWKFIMSILPRWNLLLMKVIQVYFKREKLLYLLRISIAKPDFPKRLMNGLEIYFSKIYQHMLCILFWLSIIFCASDHFYIFIGNKALRVTCIDEVFQFIKLHLNDIIHVLNYIFFNFVINFFRF